MPGFAEFTDVEARAGRYSGVFEVDGTHPNVADVEQLLTDLSAQVDIAIRSRGFSVDDLDAGVQGALRDIVAYGALARAFAGIPDSSEELERLVTYASRVWGAAMGDPGSNTAAGQRGSIASGSHPAIAALEAGAGGGGQSAGSFWEDEPAFGTPAQVRAELLTTPAELAPTFAKSQSL